MHCVYRILRIFKIKADGMYSHHCGLRFALQCTESAPLTAATFPKQSILSGSYVHQCSFLQYILQSYLFILLLLFSFYFQITGCFCYVIIYLVTNTSQFMSLYPKTFLPSTNGNTFTRPAQFERQHQSLCLETRYCGVFLFRKLTLTL